MSAPLGDGLHGVDPRDVELWFDSLKRRIGAMHHLWDLAIADLTLEQVNHHERAGVLPIAFSLMHYVGGEDRNTSQFLLDQAMLWETGGWERRIGVSVPSVDRGTPIEVAEQLRFRHLDAWREYQRSVFARTEAALEALPPDRYLERPFGDEIPASMAGAFISFVVPPGQPIRLLDVIECFIYQHGIRHLGEIEHARALVGLGGVT